MPPGPSAVAGEDDVVSPAVDSSSGPIAWMWKTQIDGHRDMGMSQVGVYSFHAGVVRGGFLPLTFVMPENQHHGYGGTKEARRYTLLNSLFRPVGITFKWSLVDRQGKVVTAGEDARELASGDVQRGEFSFDLPRVAEKTVFTLKARLESEGEFVCGEEWDFAVWPPLAAAKPAVGVSVKRRVLVFDPAGATLKTLQRLGVKAEPATHPGVPAGTAAETLLVIGENALDEPTAAAAAELAGFVEGGGRVLVLGQRVAPANLPVATRLDPKVWASQVFVRAGSHPIMSGFTSYDLHFWQPDRAVSQGAYTKPDEGNVVVLADSGNWVTGLDWVNLMEVYRGRGTYILCQLPLIAAFDREPMAMEILARMLAYLGGDGRFRNPIGTAQVLAAADSPLVAALKAARAQHRILAADAEPEKEGAILLDAEAARPLGTAGLAAFAQRLRDGATVAVLQAAPEDQAWLSEMAGAPVSIGVPPYALWDGRVYRKGWSDHTAGLSQIDLYWKRFSGAEQAAGQAEVLDNVIEPFQTWAAGAPGARELIFPGALLHLAVGRGTLLIDQRRWTTGHEDLAISCARQCAALMTALNVAIAPAVPPKDLPKEVDYRTIDLRPQANRALIDDVAEDGKGGWVDQGPRADLRSFPTGKGSFKGVPFDVGEAPKSCIVLASNARPNKEGMPKSVEIPVGFPVEGLFFLHGSAYTGDKVIANYRIEYADGTHHDIPIVGQQNIIDWAGPKALNNEKGTRSVVAWTGRNEVFPLIGVYRMLWVNEKPEVPVKSIVFSTPEFRSVIGLIGLTAAVKKGQFAATPEEAARAKRLIEEGKAAFADGRLDEARKRIQAALALDPSQADVYQVLANIAEKKGEDDWLLEAYRAWIYSGPRTPMPYNRIAEILEKRKDFKDASEYFKESLKIEWNQPPVIEAVRRLEGMGTR
jgi:Tfp pilus assembly protein PilF